MRDENEETAYDAQKSISLIDLFIIVLKYKYLILSFVLLSVTIVILYLNFFRSSSQIFEKDQKAYLSDAWIELNTVVPEHFPPMNITMQTSSLIFPKYHLPMLRYMVWDEKKGIWDIDKMYIWDEASRKMTIDNKKGSNDDIPTLRIKPQNTLCYLTFSCGDPKIPPLFLNDFIKSTADHYRSVELDQVQSRIELYKNLLSKSQDKTLRDKFSDQLVVNLELENYIKGNARLIPYTVLVAPLEVTAFSLNDLQNIKGNTTSNILLLVFTGFAAFIFILVFVVVYENLHKMKIQEPEKYSLLEKYLRFRG